MLSFLHKNLGMGIADKWIIACVSHSTYMQIQLYMFTCVLLARYMARAELAVT